MEKIKSFVEALASGNKEDAGAMFNDIMGEKVQKALDARKVALAQKTFNSVEA